MQRTVSWSRSHGPVHPSGATSPAPMSRTESSASLHTTEREMDRSIAREQRRERSRSPGPASSRNALHTEPSSEDIIYIKSSTQGHRKRESVSFSTSGVEMRRTPSSPPHAHSGSQTPSAGAGADVSEHAPPEPGSPPSMSVRVPTPLRLGQRSFTTDGQTPISSTASESGSSSRPPSRPTSPDSEASDAMYKIEISLADGKDRSWTLYTTNQVRSMSWRPVHEAGY